MCRLGSEQNFKKENLSLVHLMNFFLETSFR